MNRTPGPWEEQYAFPHFGSYAPSPGGFGPGPVRVGFSPPPYPVSPHTPSGGYHHGPQLPPPPPPPPPPEPEGSWAPLALFAVGLAAGLFLGRAVSL